MTTPPSQCGTPPQSPPSLIQGLTTSYREAQDRLYLAAKDDADQVTGLWLTRRLADRLVRKLAARLDGATHLAQAPTQSQAAIHVWQQSVAQAQHAPAQPVRLPDPTQEALIESVDITPLDRQLKLVFHCTHAVSLALIVDGTQLRQWLGMVYRNYRVAEWPTEGVWPAWFHEAATQAFSPAESDRVVH